MSPSGFVSAGLGFAVAGLWTLALLLEPAVALSAQPSPGPKDYLIDVWEHEDGLPHRSVTAIAQTPDGYLWIGTYNGLARFDGARFVTFDPANTPALKHPRVHRLFVDALGTLWIGTFDGSLSACRQGTFSLEYDSLGQEHRVHDLVRWRSNEVLFATERGLLLRGPAGPGGPGRWQVLVPLGSPQASNFCEDHEGTVWFRTGGRHLARMVGDRFERVALEEMGLSGERVNALVSDSAGRLWIGTEKEIGFLDAARRTPNSDLRSPKEDRSSNVAADVKRRTEVLTPTADEESVRLLTSAATNFGSFKTMTPTNGEAELNVQDILFAGDGGVWVVANGRLRKCRDQMWLADAGPWTSRLGRTPVGFDSCDDRRGGFWYTDRRSQLARVRTDGKVERITTKEGLPAERIDWLFRDHEGNLWVAVNRAGLVRLRRRSFQAPGGTEGLSEKIAISVCEDREGAMWIGTFQAGLNRWKDGLFSRLDVLPPGVNDDVASVYPDAQGRVWVSMFARGLFVYEGGEFKRPFPEAERVRPRALLVDSKNRVWLGTPARVYCWNGENFTEFQATNGFPSADSRALAGDTAGTIWIGTSSGELRRFKEGKFTAFRPADGLANRSIWSLLADNDGTVWVGTFGGGLLRFKDGQFTRCTTKEGLPNNVICQMLDDGQGQLWMGSHGGVFRVAKSMLHAYARGAAKTVPCVAYGKFDGLPTVECSGNYQPAGWRSHDGRLWFATVKGVVSLQPSEITVNPLPPPVVIEEVVVDGVSSSEFRVPSSSASSQPRQRETRNLEPGTLRISPGKRRFEFAYTGLSFTAPDKVRFRYKLEGRDADWVEAGTERKAIYNFLPPGNYRFHVTACNNDGVWNEAGAALALTVLPHFWQTWWFIGLATVSLLASVGGAIRYVEKKRHQRKVERLELQHAVERERLRIAQDIHDDLGASLTQLTLLGELAKRESLPLPEVRTLVATITDKTRELVRAMDEIVWAVNPRNDSLPNLSSYLCQFAQQFLRPSSVRCRLDVMDGLPAHPLTVQVRHNLFLVVKEALNSVLKHAGASEVWLRVAVKDSVLTLAVEDNGRGFAPAAIDGERNGLRNMRQRVDEVGGRFDVASQPGQGASLHITLPLPDGKPLI
jgi:ligand-binding sensor domain-containing protein/signal transduction histidine kinase